MDYKKYNDFSSVDVDDIARTLRAAANAPAATIGDLIDAVYWIKAAAQNPYNADYWRTLYNALEAITEGRPET